MRLMKALAILSSLGLAACVVTNATMLGSAKPRTPLTAAEVAIYRTADQVPGKYEEIALLHSSGDSGFTDEPKMYESMKLKAASLGANGVILDAISEPSAGAKVAAAIFGASAQRKGKAVAIYVFPSEDPPQR